jgi:hypothetical protein
VPRVDPQCDVLRIRHASERCVTTLASNVLQHPGNARLRERLQNGALSEPQFYRQLQLRVLQIVAWNIGERLGAVPNGSEACRMAYERDYSSHQLTCSQPASVQSPSDGHSQRLERVLLGLWQGDTAIALVPWGSALFDPTRVEDLATLQQSDEQTRELVSLVRDEILGESGIVPPRPDVQVLGLIHEWLLQRQLVIVQDDWAVTLETMPGHERRTTGSYFTPLDLVDDLLNWVLEPALDERAQGLDPEVARRTILSLRIVDPACGTGVFLLSAARRIAARLELLDHSRGVKPARATLADVIVNCLYGVDIGDTAVWLCRLALWFECGPPYHPQPPLERHIQCGNSIFGAWPRHLSDGIPDSAYEPTEVDDVSVARALAQRNRRERAREAQPEQMTSLSPTVAGNAENEVLADLWCAVFVWPKTATSQVPTQQSFAAIQDRKGVLPEPWLAELQRLSQLHRFFHWQLRFPDVFPNWTHVGGPSDAKPCGFDLVIGNPPWVAHAGRSTQRLPTGLKHFMLHGFASFRGYPTTHGVFVEMATRIVAKGGRVGLILPASVADLDGYAPTRAAHDNECELLCPLPDYGEGRFSGVTQPCIALVSRRSGAGRPASDRGKPWQLNRIDLDATGAALLAKWEIYRQFPPELFGERGFQSTPALRKHIRKLSEPDKRFTTALREGSDVREFQLGEPRLYADAAALRALLRPAAEFARVTVVVRQTARYPIAARSDGLAFRNSLLAVLAHEAWPWPLILCLLNSSLFRWCHYHRFRDGRQPILPQLKVGHLRSLPAPTVRDSEALTALEELGHGISRRNNGIEESERSELDRGVSKIYGLTQQEHNLVTTWHATRPR